MDRLTPLQGAAFFVALGGMVAVAHSLDNRFPMRNLAQRLMRRVRRPAETIDGYEHPEVVDVVFQKTRAFKANGPWPEMAGAASVLDFGGGCGIHYKSAIGQSPDVRWAVVETPAMVRRASEIATDRLQFFTSMADAAEWLGPIDVMHSSGALQYTPEPEATLRQLCELRAGTMLWDRLSLSSGGIETAVQVSNLVDNGPGAAPAGIKNKSVRYCRTDTPEAAFLTAHASAGYTLTGRGPNSFRFVR